MTKQRMKFVFPPEMVTQPVIYSMGKEFRVVTNIRRANVSRDRGWMIIELSGDDAEIERAIDWAKTQGVRVEPDEGDASTG